MCGLEQGRMACFRARNRVGLWVTSQGIFLLGLAMVPGEREDLGCWNYRRWAGGFGDF